MRPPIPRARLASSRWRTRGGERTASTGRASDGDSRESEAGLGDRELRGQVATLLAAGYETTAGGLTWAFDPLSFHPEAWERVSVKGRTTS